MLTICNAFVNSVNRLKAILTRSVQVLKGKLRIKKNSKSDKSLMKNNSGQAEIVANANKAV